MSETQRPGPARSRRATIRFVGPHHAAVTASDGQWLVDLSQHAHTAADRLLATAMKLGFFRAEDGSTIVEGGLVEAMAESMSSRGYDVSIIDGPYSRGLRPQALSFRNCQHSELVGLVDQSPADRIPT